MSGRLSPESRTAALAAMAAERLDVLLTDLFSRRTRIDFESFDRGVAAAPYTAHLVADRLGWDDAEVAAQVATYRHRIAAQRASEATEDDRSAATALIAGA